MWRDQSDRFIVNNRTSQTALREIKVLNECALSSLRVSSARANNLRTEMYVALTLADVHVSNYRIPLVQLAVRDVTRPLFPPHI